MDLKNTANLNRTVIEYKYSEADFILPGITWRKRRQYAEDRPFLSDFDTALRSDWEEKMKQGLFRYPLWSLQTRILPGNVKYVAQLNIKRGIERRKPQDTKSIQEKFNPKQFNFNKIISKEIMFKMIRSPKEKADSSACIDVNPEGNREVPDNDAASALLKHRQDHILVVINVSPLEFGHVLFIPDPSLCLTQILTPDLMLFGLESILLSGHPGFRVGFNSLGGFASVNHLHLHGFYLDEELLIESALSKPLCPELNFHQLTHFPAPGFFFYTDGKDLVPLSRRICQVTDYFVNQNIAHNVFVTRGSDPGNQNYPDARKGIRIVIWARKSCFGAKEESAFNVALCELAGHLPFKNEDEFSSITEESVICIIKKYLLSDEDFSQLSLELIDHLTI
ncbi:GDP-D-glucose phosphorylase 1 [Pseudophryne corroboree]|uniref:GDP-D-glucose phosphorylase 1 n=1 Tax=Pseudophryne corroboree TaxID=495146 RepID=UPI0030820F30